MVVERSTKRSDTIRARRIVAARRLGEATKGLEVAVAAFLKEIGSETEAHRTLYQALVQFQDAQSEVETAEEDYLVGIGAAPRSTRPG